ncbi:unnamed protein product [Medioppia subpectinata]|uniref:Protein zer-1 n=1 Tax=Medioppia subpectinata TaxID=1979941 RepID=A0A7R9KPX7_9ACAR|nr:unnamed protein product [Medioppia subpectinata]CAG2107636.1 unnamed protein product [Medioppia subpectinata]
MATMDDSKRGAQLWDNSPDSLLKTCLRYVVREGLDLRPVSLPREICDLLIHVYRETHVNDSELASESLQKFMSQFRANNSRVCVAKFADLSISDETLESFLEEHSKSIIHLDVSNCPHLTGQALTHINTALTRVVDPRRLRRTVRVIEEGPCHECRVLYTKHYANGVITTTRDNCTVDENVGLITDDYSLTQAMGIFDDPDFSDFKARKIRELNGIRGYDWRLSDEAMAVECNGVPAVATNRSPIPVNECEFYKPSESFSKNMGDNRIKTLEIKTWQPSPLQTLIIGCSAHILPDYIEEDGLHDEDSSSNSHLINPLLTIRKLVIHEWNPIDASAHYLKYLINSQMKHTLQHLDLSNGSAIGYGSPLEQLRALKTLILYNCPKLHLAINKIVKIKTLRCLDISATDDRYGHVYGEPNAQLALIVNSLPELTRLDISGTNLAGPRLYKTADEAANRRAIPAHSVSGDATEEQILTACEVYIDRVEFLERTLNDLFDCFNSETNFHDVNRALEIVLQSMSRHLPNECIQTLATALLFYIVHSYEANLNFNIKVKRLIVTKLLDAMHKHRYDIIILRNGILALVHFEIPTDVIYELSRLTDIISIVTNFEDDVLLRMGLMYLEDLMCGLDDYHKTIVGHLAIDQMLSLIDTRLQSNICDEAMERAWSIMWTASDTTHANCERFIDCNGMDVFVRCLQSFPNSAQLLRNMTGMVANVALCEELRPRLMSVRFIKRFVQLLDNESAGIEVSYNAAAILSHIAGENKWPYDRVRDNALNQLSAAIKLWKINSKIKINYRSFKPFLRLLKSSIPSGAQYWSVWALANLTRVKSKKYCPLLKNDNGLEVLEQLADSDSVPDYIKDLSSLTLYQYDLFVKVGHLTALESSEDLKIPADYVRQSHQ